MVIYLKLIRFLLLVMFPLLAMEGTDNFTWAQEISPESAASSQAYSIRIGPHPVYTRILINLTEPASYQVKPDFSNKQIVLILSNTEKGPRLVSKSFNDKNLEQYVIRPIHEDLKVTFLLKNQNTRFFHSMNPQKPQIIIDIKGEDRPILRTRIGQSKSQSATRESVDSGPVSAPLPKKSRLVGHSPKEIKDIVVKSKEEKDLNGWEDYQKALIAFQGGDYPSAAKVLREFYEKYPASKYLDPILYLKAEAEYRITFKELNPIFDQALVSYKLAMRKLPQSKFYDHALLKVASIFDEIGYNLEARTLYNQGLNSKPKSLYNEERRNKLAAMLMKEGQLEKAFDAFQAILRKSPNNIEAKAGIFEIAYKFFDKKDYPRALKIFESGVKRWPSELNAKPEINYAMAEIYFSEKNI
jgi:TolA-binding protein